MLRRTYTSSGMLGALVFGLALTGCGDEVTDPNTPVFGTDSAVGVITNDGGAAEAGTVIPNPTNPGAATALPAEVCTVLQNNGCIGCHKAQLEGSAPMPLQTVAELSPFAERAVIRMKDAVRPMPPVTTQRPLPSAADVAVLQTWISAGKQGVVGSPCQVSGSNVGGGDAGTGTPDGGSPVNPGAPSWANQPWPEGQCKWVLKIGAHGSDMTPFKDDPSGFPVPAKHTSYECFYEKVPWGNAKVQALAMRVHNDTPDDKALVHHIVVSGRGPNDGDSIAGAQPRRPGDHRPCDNPSGSTVGVWAPGALDPVTYPSDVGVLMPSGNDAYIEMQVHYNNTSSAGGKKSRVSYDICVTDQLRPQSAGVFWLGYENANAQTLAPGFEFLGGPLDNKGNGTGAGICSAKTRGRILWMAPHMHEQGQAAKVEILRKNGQTQVIHDKPFDFQEQTAYFQDNLWVEQGENVRTTCKWKKSPVYFGFASEMEMCFVYTLAYPIETFKAGAGEKGIVGGDFACAAKKAP